MGTPAHTHNNPIDNLIAKNKQDVEYLRQGGKFHWHGGPNDTIETQKMDLSVFPQEMQDLYNRTHGLPVKSASDAMAEGDSGDDGETDDPMAFLFRSQNFGPDYWRSSWLDTGRPLGGDLRTRMANPAAPWNPNPGHAPNRTFGFGTGTRP